VTAKSLRTAGVGIAVVVAAGIILAWARRDTGTPTAHALRDAIARVAGSRCAGRIKIYKIKSIGGNLPDGMRQARHIACDHDVAVHGGTKAEFGYPTLATQYVFDNAGDARAWLRDSEYHLGPTTWILRGHTLIGRGPDLPTAEWRTAIAGL
jgi:hypothetical protein